MFQLRSFGRAFEALVKTKTTEQNPLVIMSIEKEKFDAPPCTDGTRLKVTTLLLSINFRRDGDEQGTGKMLYLSRLVLVDGEKARTIRQ
jgi:hypothetical protein